MTDLSLKFKELDGFVVKMKMKMIERRDKHQDNNPLLIGDLIHHLIDEIGELFQIEDTDFLREVFNAGDIKQDELPDVANMCWVVDLALTHGEIK